MLSNTFVLSRTFSLKKLIDEKVLGNKLFIVEKVLGNTILLPSISSVGISGNSYSRVDDTPRCAQGDKTGCNWTNTLKFLERKDR